MALDYPQLEFLIHEVRNRNEIRVANLIPQALAEYPGYTPNQNDYEDIYALTLNNLPSRYAQHLSLIFQERITDEVILEVMHKAIRRIQDHPH